MAKKLKILEVCNLDRFAASPYMLPLFGGLAEAGHEVHVACHVTSFGDILREAGLEVHDLPLTRRITPLEDLKAYRALKSLLREGRYDVVHTHNPKDGILGRTAAWKLGVPAVIHTCNGFYFSHRSSRLKRWLVLQTERYAGRHCHLVIFVNGDDLALAAARKVVGTRKARLIYNGVDLERFRPGDDGGLREELGIPGGAVVLGYIGEIRRERNLDTLVEAAARLLPRHPDLYLVFAGDSSMEPQEPERLRGLASRAGRVDGAETGGGLSDRLLFTGYRHDPERFYRLFDVYVLPSTREGFGVTLIEGMATGIPVVACRVRGPREIIDDGVNGILVADRDPAALADAVAFCLEAPEAVGNYTRRAREKVEREFDHAIMRSSLYEEYRRLTS
ncbi:MAG: glycosyltransferase family 4 protein [Actinomycetota bacterium]|nr:glycosyltransferase family 4 protein [Actinomycetota bacterium]MDD5665864.1 glycosyltransferase family 4 protein [Actinomycetota bacterium]